MLYKTDQIENANMGVGRPGETEQGQGHARERESQ